ncbi:MAG TPA: hypothetical protein VMI56_01840 [Reyranella sp.]|nr:hypothetical protein [Reyranella sp.]
MKQAELNWIDSKMVGQVSEIAVLAPIKRGRIPGERRTYEERLQFLINNLQGRAVQGLPTELDKVLTIHFGRMIIIRPEQYLLYSDVPGVAYHDNPVSPDKKVPKLIDEYREADDGKPPNPLLRSWVLTLVEFDGDLRAYFKDIAQFLGSLFDQIFVNCEDFPGTSKFEEFWQWIRRYQVSSNLFYPHYRDLSVVRIKQLQDFKRRFDDFVARVRSPTGRKVERIDELFDEFLRESQQYGENFPGPGGVFEAGK